jgi:hypothetical protein
VVLSRPLLEGENTTTGGFVEKRLKKLKGLRFTFPSSSIVDANAIGLGAMACCSQLCLCGVVSSFRLICMPAI